jgi:hypothetical protein
MHGRAKSNMNHVPQIFRYFMGLKKSDDVSTLREAASNSRATGKGRSFSYSSMDEFGQFSRPREAKYVIRAKEPAMPSPLSRQIGEGHLPPRGVLAEISTAKVQTFQGSHNYIS